MVLEEYKEFIGKFAMIVTMLQMSSGVFICKDIYKKGTSKGVDPMPFLGGIGLCILMLRYALMLGDFTMIVVNLFGLATSLSYMIWYYHFTSNTQKVHKLIFKITIFVLMLIGYAQIEDSTKIEYRFGIVVTVLLLLLIGAPLVHISDVIKTKNTEILPFPLIFMGTFVSFLWLLYGFSIDNIFVIFQNAVGLALNVAQLSLFIIFPSKKSQGGLLSEQKKED
ncbi:sugar transporter SWEET1 isoform X1 [Linepithema humile]|uniref:sugar transporter SWEET1 isoform X1 n=1 Tax=Linepithema humile TaxID=83485 RepID=UPI0006239AC1|nr:PREDICTED: sugar transporter SWEET1 [Linepithema humile]